MRKIKDWLYGIFEIIYELVKIGLNKFQKHFNKILIVAYFIISLIAINNFENCSKKDWLIFLSAMFFTFILVSYVYEKLDKKKDLSESKFPVVEKRFTKRSLLDDNMVYIDKENWQGAVLYLSEVEDYLENVGYKKN